MLNRSTTVVLAITICTCNGRGFIDHRSDTNTWGEVSICPCGIIPIDKLEAEAIARLRTNKIESDVYNIDLELINTIKRHKL